MRELTVGVHTMNYVCGVEPRERGWHFCCSGYGRWYCMDRGGDFRVGGLQGSSWPPTFSFYGLRGKRDNGSCRLHLAGATEAGVRINNVVKL